MFDITQLATNEKSENEGVWIDFDGGLRLKIARVNNDAHEGFMLEQRRKFAKKKRVGASIEIGKEKLHELTVESMAKHILLDWENMRENGGEPIPYSVAEATRMLSSYKEFYKLVEAEAMDIANFRDEMEAEELGNSGSSADGTDDGVTPSNNSDPSNDKE